MSPELTALDRKFLNLDDAYPAPIIDHIEAGREAETYMDHSQPPEVGKESKESYKSTHFLGEEMHKKAHPRVSFI